MAFAEAHKSEKATDLLPPGDEQEESPTLEKNSSRLHKGLESFTPLQHSSVRGDSERGNRHL